MNSRYPRIRPLRPACLLLLAAVDSVSAQSVSPAPASNTTPVQLSVFEVSEEKDTGYAASTAMSGTRTNEKLENLPNAISVLTRDLLEDLGALNFLDAADFAISTENIYNDSGTRGAPRGTRSGNQVDFRGLPAIRQLRDGFPWYMPEDMFNTDRIEFSRGPGGLSYGDVDAGGTINIATKRAQLGTSNTRLQTRFDNFGTQRGSVDFQRTLLPKRVAVRLNAVYSDVHNWRDRNDTFLRGYAAAVRWQIGPRTHVDITAERGILHQGTSHVVLTDQTPVYVHGTGTNALDANPAIAGNQADGVGMFRTQPAGVKQIWNIIDGQAYNLESTATAVFRHSRAQQGAGAANALTNPNLIPQLPISESIVPRGQDWGGPNNFVESRWAAYTVDFKHQVSDKFSLQLAVNAQTDDVTRPELNNTSQNTFGGRAIFIDVNPNLPDPTDLTGTRLIPNPRYEQLYILHQRNINNDGHDIQNYRGVAVYDWDLPFDIHQRVVGSAGWRHEKYYSDVFNETLSREEIVRRGLTGEAAFFSNNQLFRYHYLADGNSDRALANEPIPGITAFPRDDILTENARFDQNLASASVNLLGSLFHGRLRTSIGLSRDRWEQETSRTGRRPVTNEIAFLDGAGNLLPEGAAIPTFPFTTEWVTNQTYGGVFNVTPWFAVTAAYLESSQFTDNYGALLDGRPLKALQGEGVDVGARFNFLGGRLRASYVRFDTKGKNVSSNVSNAVRNELQPLLAESIATGQDTRDRHTVGDEVEIFFSPTPQWSGRIAYANSDMAFTNFYPLLKPRLAAAQAHAQSLGQDPAVATATTVQFLADQAALNSTARTNANALVRYTFTDGALKGLSIGCAARYSAGRDVPEVNIANVIVLPAGKTVDEYIFNPFITYRRRLGRVTWTSQININNVLDRVTNQGTTYRFARLTDPRQFIFTNSISF